MCRNVKLIQWSVEILTWMMKKLFHGSSLPLCTLENIYICFGTITIFYYLTMHYKVSYHHLRSGKTEGWRLKDRGFKFLLWRIFFMYQIQTFNGISERKHLNFLALLHPLLSCESARVNLRGWLMMVNICTKAINSV